MIGPGGGGAGMNPQGYVSDYYKNRMGPGFGGMGNMNEEFPYNNQNMGQANGMGM